MLIDDREKAKVRTTNISFFPKNTVGEIITCRFIPKTTERVYLFQTNENIVGMVDGVKTAWYLERDLENI